MRTNVGQITNQEGHHHEHWEGPPGTCDFTPLCMDNACQPYNHHHHHHCKSYAKMFLSSCPVTVTIDTRVTNNDFFNTSVLNQHMH